MSIGSILAVGPVIPVVTIEKVNQAIELSDALAEGGIGVIEITLRSGCALEAIALLSRERPKMTIGAGTVLKPHQIREAKLAGADFVVSPGSYRELLKSAIDEQIAILPGAASASEVMRIMSIGKNFIKFFPALEAGGPLYLEALAAPLKDAFFCPTGGITLKTAPDWLSLPNVICVGGSWVAPSKLIADEDFDTIMRNARECQKLI